LGYSCRIKLAILYIYNIVAHLMVTASLCVSLFIPLARLKIPGIIDKKEKGMASDPYQLAMMHSRGAGIFVGDPNRALNAT